MQYSIFNAHLSIFSFLSPASQQHFPSRGQLLLYVDNNLRGVICWTKNEVFNYLASCLYASLRKRSAKGNAKALEKSIVFKLDIWTVYLLRFGEKWKEILTRKNNWYCPDFYLHAGWLALLKNNQYWLKHLWTMPSMINTLILPQWRLGSLSRNCNSKLDSYLNVQ